MKKVTMDNAMRNAIITRIANGNLVGAADVCRTIAKMFPESDDYRTWPYNLLKFADFCDTVGDRKPEPAFSIFALKGNQKLPFCAFSAMSGSAFCPGAGACLDWCYTITAHRYPMAFFRMLQNTMLLRSIEGRTIIANELSTMRIKRRDDFVLRLYVDGDHENEEVLKFWMELLKANPAIKAYGYSKSFNAFLSLENKGYIWPTNYVLNVSGGHRHTNETVSKIKALPITRGDFLAVGTKGKLDYNTRAYVKAARKAYHNLYGADAPKPFVCPGDCGACTAKVHACGSMRFKEIPVIILTH